MESYWMSEVQNVCKILSVRRNYIRCRGTSNELLCSFNYFSFFAALIHGCANMKKSNYWSSIVSCTTSRDQSVDYVNAFRSLKCVYFSWWKSQRGASTAMRTGIWSLPREIAPSQRDIIGFGVARFSSDSTCKYLLVLVHQVTFFLLRCFEEIILLVVGKAHSARALCVELAPGISLYGEQADFTKLVLGVA